MKEKSASFRVRIALRRNRLYVKAEQLRLLLSPKNAKKILFSGRVDWIDDIKKGFRRLPHEIEFGGITEDSFNRYDIVVPLSLAALEEARRCSLRQNSTLPLPTAQAVRLCDDKYLFNDALIKAGFGRYIPRMAHGQALTPPFILKKRIGVWGKDCYIIRNYDDQAGHADRINSPEYFCQEIIAGPIEFATHILFVDNKIVKALNIKYEFATDTPIKGQDTPIFQVVHRCPFLDLFEQILRTIEFEGLCCVNYKVAKGQPFLLEINPRFGGSLAPYFFSFVRHFAS
jgi:predicted ATP-grasp superfamily ATP-dependent carboligase